MLTVIGDPMGETEKLNGSVKGNTIALGDLSLGVHTRSDRLPSSKTFKFIYGDCDLIQKAVRHDGFLGHFGYIKPWRLFYCSGGGGKQENNVVDKDKLLHKYKSSKPKIVISHDAPIEGAYHTFGVLPQENGINTLLQKMFEEWQPELWIFSHWKKDATGHAGLTKFICLDELSTFPLNV